MKVMALEGLLYHELIRQLFKHRVGATIPKIREEKTGGKPTINMHLGIGNLLNLQIGHNT